MIDTRWWGWVTNQAISHPSTNPRLFFNLHPWHCSSWWSRLVWWTLWLRMTDARTMDSPSRQCLGPATLQRPRYTLTSPDPAAHSSPVTSLAIGSLPPLQQPAHASKDKNTLSIGQGDKNSSWDYTTNWAQPRLAQFWFEFNNSFIVICNTKRFHELNFFLQTWELTSKDAVKMFLGDTKLCNFWW